MLNEYDYFDDGDDDDEDDGGDDGASDLVVSINMSQFVLVDNKIFGQRKHIVSVKKCLVQLRLNWIEAILPTSWVHQKD